MVHTFSTPQDYLMITVYALSTASADLIPNKLKINFRISCACVFSSIHFTPFALILIKVSPCKEKYGKISSFLSF